MVNKFDNVEAGLLLESLAEKRIDTLGSIAVVQMLKRDAISITPRELVAIMHDNSITDAYMQRFFGQGILAMPGQVEELHFKRCENSGVVECTCLVNNDKPRVTIL